MPVLLWIATALSRLAMTVCVIVIASEREAIQLACRYVTRHIDDGAATHGSGGLTTSK
jgi:hypothetical protein